MLMADSTSWLVIMVFLTARDQLVLPAFVYQLAALYLITRTEILPSLYRKFFIMGRVMVVVALF